MKSITLALGPVLGCLLSAPMSAANIVADPGFELGGNCSGAAACNAVHPSWTFIDAVVGDGYGVDGLVPHTGVKDALFQSTSSDIIQQALATTVGQFYTLSFWLNTSNDHSNADFKVLWNGTQIYDDPSGTDASHQFAYTQFTLPSLQATGSSTVLEFTGFNVPNTDYFDDISVTLNASGVPEPATWVLTCVGVLAVALRRRLIRSPSRIDPSRRGSPRVSKALMRHHAACPH
jgi:hypothetical protein